jgi:C-terminal processing protease CtpA/Prc
MKIFFYPLMPLCLLLVGCATNGYSSFYREGQSFSAANIEPFSGNTKIIETTDPQKDAQNLVQRGYHLLGESSFMSRHSENEYLIKQQAKKVGADIVLYSEYYLGAEQISLPTLDYDSGQTFTTYTPNGLITTTSSGRYRNGMQTYTVRNFAHNASFWRKGKAPVFGAYVGDLPEETRKFLQRNTGIVIQTVIDNSPAYYSNIIVGDIITSVNDIPILNAENFIKNVVPKIQNSQCTFHIIRDGKEMDISVKTNPIN